MLTNRRSNCRMGAANVYSPAKPGASMVSPVSWHGADRLIVPMQAHHATDSMSAPLPPAIALRRSLGRYAGQPLGIRGFVLARHLLAPLARVLAAVPARGRLLD